MAKRKKTMSTKQEHTPAPLCDCIANFSHGTMGLRHHIVYCNLHAAAPKLLEALTRILADLDDVFDGGKVSEKSKQQALEAIVHAEGRE